MLVPRSESQLSKRCGQQESIRVAESSVQAGQRLVEVPGPDQRVARMSYPKLLDVGDLLCKHSSEQFGGCLAFVREEVGRLLRAAFQGMTEP